MRSSDSQPMQTMHMQCKRFICSNLYIIVQKAKNSQFIHMFHQQEAIVLWQRLHQMTPRDRQTG